MGVSVQFLVGQTGLLLMRMIIRLSAFSTAIRMHMLVFSSKLQGIIIFNATMFSELAHHTETKMTIFTSGPLQGFRRFSGTSARRPR